MRRLYLLVLLCVSLLGCKEPPVAPPPQPASSYNNDIMAYHPSQYSKAYTRFHQAAMQGDATAQNNLGRMYADGRGVDRNSEEAVRWFTAAAKQGNVDAEMNLGVAYLYGQGVLHNQTQACTWFGKASKAGNPEGNEMYHRYCI